MPTHDPVPSFADFARSYQARFIETIQRWDLTALAKLKDEMVAVRARGGTVFIAGNGGSAAIANHFECDASKGTHVDGHSPMDTRSLAANPSMLTAIGNDFSFAEIFERQLTYFAKKGDLVVLVSSSGNSPNVVTACDWAKSHGIRTAALVGFSGGALKTKADVVVHIDLDNYGIVEDLHQACVHLVTQYLKLAITPVS